MPKPQQWLGTRANRQCVILLLLPAFASVTYTNANASQSATFACAAGPAQVCYFSIPRQPNATQNFVVQGGQRTSIAGLAPGHDWYEVGINHPPPATAYACQHANFRCKVGVIRLGTNQ